MFSHVWTGAFLHIWTVAILEGTTDMWGDSTKLMILRNRDCSSEEGLVECSGLQLNEGTYGLSDFGTVAPENRRSEWNSCYPDRDVAYSLL